MSGDGVGPSLGAMDKPFIGIAGLIGVGKSTLASALAQHLDIPAHFEPVGDNAYLEDFYADTAKHAFALWVLLRGSPFRGGMHAP